MLRRHIACQRDGQAVRLVRNKCKGRVTRGPYVRLRPPAYVTRSTPRGRVGSPPGRGTVAQADRSAPDWARTRVVTGPPPGSCACSILGPCCAWPEPCTGGPGPVQGSGHARGGSGPCSEVRSVRIGVRYFPMGVRTHCCYSGVYRLFWPRGNLGVNHVVGSGAVYHAARGSRMGTAPSHCSKGTPVSGYRHSSSPLLWSLFGPSDFDITI
jgi:hypothetical protein